VQILGPIRDELPRDGRRVFGKHSFLLIIALPQPDAFATAQIDCRPNLHNKTSKESIENRGWVKNAET
jgi:hypothetical protein